MRRLSTYVPKKKSSSLRSRADDDVCVEKEESKLKVSAKIVYDWLHQKKSSIRLVHQWQAAGGLSFVANVYNTGMQAFLEQGGKVDAITLEVFQKCILERHDVSKSSKRRHNDVGD